MVLLLLNKTPSTEQKYVFAESTFIHSRLFTCKKAYVPIEVTDAGIFITRQSNSGGRLC